MRSLVIAFACLLISAPCHGTLTPPFPGFDALIDYADAIAIVRVESVNRGNGVSVDHWESYQCMVYHALKGGFAEGQKIDLTLFGALVPFPHSLSSGTEYLIFLQNTGTANNPSYRSLTHAGAIIRVSPFGNEKSAPGTVREQIEHHVKAARAYWTKEQEKENEFLDSLLSTNSPAKFLKPKGK